MADLMRIVLMHKNTEVASFDIDEDTGNILSKIDVISEEALPLPVQFSKGNEFAMVDAMKGWVAYRSVPSSRSNFKHFLEENGVSTPSAMAYKSLGLNLSDQYWYRPQKSELEWNDINLFDNNFLKQDFKVNTTVNGSFVSPDSNSNGELPKFWCVEDGKRILYKQGDGAYLQQPYNELFASKLLHKLNISHVSYGLSVIKNTAYSTCETFITKDTEYIPAWDVLNAIKKSNSDNAYQHFFKCVERLNIPVKKQDIDNMLAFDYLINNSDRHYGNFGFIRDANTMNFIGMAPIFDNGNSLWYQYNDMDITLLNNTSKPFREKHDKQIKLARDANLNINRLSERFIMDTINETYFDIPRISETRKTSIVRNVLHNFRELGKYINNTSSLIR